MLSNEINQNNPLPFFEGLQFYVDAFNERRRIQSVMPIFYEEQPLTWKLYEEELNHFMANRTNPRILDVGCGSGFWGLLLKKKFPQADVVCIDKNPVAIERARYNALLNGLEITLEEAFYKMDLFNEECFDLIVLTAPYHLYDPADSEHIPLFARGGDYGLQEFYAQSVTAFHHLRKNGMILFNQMSAGNETPDYIRFYEHSFGMGLLEYTNILPPIKTSSFLEELYGANQSQYLRDFEHNMPMLYYTSGIYIKNSNDFSFSENTNDKTTILSKICLNWQTRIELHKEINQF